MKTLRVLPLALLGPSLALQPGQSIAFDPDEGSQVGKTFEIVADFMLEDLSVVVDGEDVGAMLGGLDFSVRTETMYAVQDVYLASEAGRPLKLSRTYDSLESFLNMSFMTEFGGEDQDISSSSDLEGQTVHFTWDPEAGSYAASYEDDDGDPDLLEGLEEDMDLRSLLPEDEVEEGESWEVAVTDLAGLMMPGGNLGLIPEGAEADMAEFEDVAEMFEEKLKDLGQFFDGSCQCTYRGRQEEDGAVLAEIGITIEVESDIDLSDLLLDFVDILSEEFGEEAPDISLETADLSISFEGEGTLLWDLNAGRMRSFDMEGEAEFSIDLSVTAEMNGEGGTLEFYAELSGELQESVETE